jgi:hypothetical protein
MTPGGGPSELAARGLIEHVHERIPQRPCEPDGPMAPGRLNGPVRRPGGGEG